MEHLEKSKEITIRCSETILECSLCMEQFVSPRILPCQHTFCRECLIELISTNCLNANGSVKQRSFPCPICRRDCKLKRGDNISMEEHLKGFPENLLMINLIDAKRNSDEEVTVIVNKKEKENEAEENKANTNKRNLDISNALNHYLTILHIFLGYISWFKSNSEGEHFRRQSVNTELALHLRLCMAEMWFHPLANNEGDLSIDRSLIDLAAMKFDIAEKMHLIHPKELRGRSWRDVCIGHDAVFVNNFNDLFRDTGDTHVRTVAQISNGRRVCEFILYAFVAIIFVCVAIYLFAIEL